MKAITQFFKVLFRDPEVLALKIMIEELEALNKKK